MYPVVFDDAVKEKEITISNLAEKIIRETEEGQELLKQVGKPWIQYHRFPT